MNATFPSGENAIPLHLTKPSATTRTDPVSGSKRYTWFGNNGSGRKWLRNPYLREMRRQDVRVGIVSISGTHVTSVKNSLFEPG